MTSPATHPPLVPAGTLLRLLLLLLLLSPVDVSSAVALTIWLICRAPLTGPCLRFYLGSVLAIRRISDSHAQSYQCIVCF